MSYIPKNLQLFLNKLDGMSKNFIKVFPQNATSFTPGQIISVKLPSNSLVDLHSLHMMMRGSTTTSTSFAGFPKHTSSLIQRLDVYINNVQVGLQGLDQYGAAFSLLSGLVKSADKLSGDASVLEGGAEIAAPSANTTAVDLCINDWLGMLGGGMTRFIDTTFLGDVEIRITLAPAEVLAQTATTTGANYILAGVYFLLEQVSFENNLYAELVSRRLASGQPVVYPFKNWACVNAVSSSTSATVTFNVASQSVDALYATLRPSNYDSAGVVVNTSAGTSNYFAFTSDGVNTLMQYQINGRPFPTFQATPADAYALTRHALGGSSGNQLYANNIQSLARWRGGQFAFGVSLHHDSAEDERLISGLDTRGTNVPFVFQYSGGATSGGTKPFILVEMTSQLEVYAGRSLVFVQ